MKADSSEPACVIVPPPNILEVLGPSDVPQVFHAVIIPDAVDVVDIIDRPLTRLHRPDCAMGQHLLFQDATT
jgi:hypothetical protein